jgi:hypothetical protein
MRAVLMTVCALALAPFAWAADESYTIKIKRFPAPGKSITVRDSSKTSSSAKVTDADGKVLNDKRQQEGAQEEYTETTIEKGDKAPKKFKRFYRKARADKGKGSKAEPYEGKVILYELKDGKYHVSVEGKDELPAKSLDKLAKQADDRLKEDVDTVLLPGKPVKVGDTWAIPGKKLATLPIPGIDPARSKGEGRLVKVYTKGGRQWGTLYIRATLLLGKLEKLEFDPPGSMMVEGTLDTPIDGSSAARRLNATLTLAGKAKVEEAGQRLTIDLKVRLEGKDEREE